MKEGGVSENLCRWRSKGGCKSGPNPSCLTSYQLPYGTTGNALGNVGFDTFCSTAHFAIMELWNPSTYRYWTKQLSWVHSIRRLITRNNAPLSLQMMAICEKFVGLSEPLAFRPYHRLATKLRRKEGPH